MGINWTQNLSVGINEIDEQHKVWFEKANALFDACIQQKGKDYISHLLDFLDEYTKIHFSDEEKYMLQINYPEYSNQKGLHSSFINELEKLKSDYESSGGNVAVVINANQLILKWLTNHILLEDKKIGDFVNNSK